MNTMRSPAEERRHLFVTLWVLAFSFHYFDSHPIAPLFILVGLSGLGCLIAPGSKAAFGLFIGVSSLAIVLDFPAPSNHFMLALLVHLVFAASALTLFVQRRFSRGSDWLSMARTPAVLTLLVIYFFAVFHKLNTSFFDPAVSCAGVLPEQALRLLGADVTLPPWVVSANAWLTIGWETAVLILLAVRRLQRWGILLGVLAHAGLGLALFFDFATFVFAIYVLLLPNEALQCVRKSDRWRALALVAWGAMLVFVAGSRLTASAVSPLGPTWHALQAGAWLVFVGALLGPPLYASFAGGRQSAAPPWSVRPAWLLVFPAFAFLNGLTPYLGLKTVANYSMFSNLRTEEGVTNHLVPALQALETTDWLRDTVEIHELEFPHFVQLGWLEVVRGGTFRLTRQTRWLREPRPVRVPWLELRRAVWLWKSAGIEEIRIVYERNGTRRETEDATFAPELAGQLSRWIRLLGAFRAIDPPGQPAQCRW